MGMSRNKGDRGSNRSRMGDGGKLTLWMDVGGGVGILCLGSLGILWIGIQRANKVVNKCTS